MENYILIDTEKVKSETISRAYRKADSIVKTSKRGVYAGLLMVSLSFAIPYQPIVPNEDIPAIKKLERYDAWTWASKSLFFGGIAGFLISKWTLKDRLKRLEDIENVSITINGRRVKDIKN